MNFEAINFIRNLAYMGNGMLGIFVVIGIIIGVTALLNRLTAKKQSNK